MGKQHDFGKAKSKPEKLPKQKSRVMELVDKAKDLIEEVRSVEVGTSRMVREKSEEEAVGTSRPSLDDVMSLEVGTREGFERGISELRKKMSNRMGRRFLEVMITLDGEEAFTLIIRRKDLYLLGFRLRDGTLYEFGKSGKRLLGIRSKFLGYKESYKQMGGLGKVTIGHGALMGAVKEVMSGVGLKIEKDISNWKFRIGSCLATICVMVIECGRFKWMDLKIISLMEVNGSNQIIDPWMPGLIQDWATISDAARTGEECKEAPPAFKLDYDVEDLRKAREYKNWEENALALLQESEKNLPYQMTVDYSSFKLLLVGDGATGKTTFLKRHLTGEYKDYYAPTTEVELHPLDFRTNHEDHEEIRFYCWDLAGRRDHMGVDEGHRYYVNAECAIIMFDFTSKASYEEDEFGLL